MTKSPDKITLFILRGASVGTRVYKTILITGCVIGILIFLSACAEEGPGIFYLSPEEFAPEFNKLIEWKLGLDERRAKGCRQEVKEPGIDVEIYRAKFNHQIAAENYRDARTTFENLWEEVRHYDQRVRHARCPLHLPDARYQIPAPAYPP